MKALAAIAVIGVLGLATGVGLFELAMKAGWPYPSFDWLSHLLGVDGEKAYDAMTAELVIEATAFYLVGWLLFRRRRETS